MGCMRFVIGDFFDNGVGAQTPVMYYYSKLNLKIDLTILIE